MIRYILFTFFFVFIFGQKDSIFNTLNYHELNEKVEGYWYVYAKTSWDNKFCQTFYFTNNGSTILLREQYSTFFEETNVVIPLQKDKFKVSNDVWEIVFHNNDLLLVKINKDVYILRNTLDINKDSFEDIFIEILISLQGYLFKNFNIVYC